MCLLFNSLALCAICTGLASYYYLATVMDVDPLTDYDVGIDSSEPDTISEDSVELDSLANPSSDMSEPTSADDSVSVECFEVLDLPSSTVMTGTNDSNTKTTHTSSNCIRRNSKRFWCSLILLTVALLLIVIGVTLIATGSNIVR